MVVVGGIAVDVRSWEGNSTQKYSKSDITVKKIKKHFQDYKMLYLCHRSSRQMVTLAIVTCICVPLFVRN